MTPTLPDARRKRSVSVSFSALKALMRSTMWLIVVAWWSVV